jgi:hypothetical protein
MVECCLLFLARTRLLRSWIKILSRNLAPTTRGQFRRCEVLRNPSSTYIEIISSHYSLNAPHNAQMSQVRVSLHCLDPPEGFQYSHCSAPWWFRSLHQLQNRYYHTEDSRFHPVALLHYLSSFANVSGYIPRGIDLPVIHRSPVTR